MDACGRQSCDNGVEGVCACGSWLGVIASSTWMLARGRSESHRSTSLASQRFAVPTLIGLGKLSLDMKNVQRASAYLESFEHLLGSHEVVGYHLAFASSQKQRACQVRHSRSWQAQKRPSVLCSESVDCCTAAWLCEREGAPSIVYPGQLAGEIRSRVSWDCPEDNCRVHSGQSPSHLGGVSVKTLPSVTSHVSSSVTALRLGRRRR